MPIPLMKDDHNILERAGDGVVEEVDGEAAVEDAAIGGGGGMLDAEAQVVEEEDS
jgi:hypothetical protein